MTPTSYQPLADQTAVVTGASSGIGRAIALTLAEAGAHVLVHARRSLAAAEEVAREARQWGRKTNVFLADIANAQARLDLVEAAWDWRPVDIWVNNAGADVLTGPASLWSFAEKLERLWAVDVQGTVFLSRDVGARMKERGRGVIINIGWDQAAQGMAGESGEMFGTTKGAIEAFSRSLAKSLAPEVRVNCVAPGWIRTSWGEDASDYWQQRVVRESLRGRWGRPEDVAQACRFLVSPAADYITGQTINVNGGFRTSE